MVALYCSTARDCSSGVNGWVVMIRVQPLIVPDTRTVHEEIQCNGAVVKNISSNWHNSTPTTFEMIDACDTQTPVIEKESF